MSYINKCTLSNIIYLTNNDLEINNIQLYQLIGITDALLTDYSSVSLDYLLTDKPIGYLLNNFTSFQNGRGFAYHNPLEYMPGEHIYTFQDLIQFINNIAHGIDEYKERRKIVNDYVNKHQDDKNCERVVKYFNI